METTKQEYLEDDHLTKLIKTEEGFAPLINQSYSKTTSFSQLSPSFYPMQLSLPTNNILLSPMLSHLNFQHYSSLSFTGCQFIDPFTMAHRSWSSSTTASSEEIKPVTHIKKLETSKKKKPRVSACKNYIGLVCAGFSRSLLTAEKNSEILNKMQGLITEKKTNFKSLQNYKNKVLIDCIKKEIYRTMCGKKCKKLNQERDFKIRSTQELETLLNIKEQDDELACLRKEVVQGLVKYFFDSRYYNDWVSNGMMSETNRLFFLNNKEEIQKKFQNPATYKPHFNYTSSRELLSRQAELLQV